VIIPGSGHRYRLSSRRVPWPFIVQNIPRHHGNLHCRARNPDRRKFLQAVFLALLQGLFFEFEGFLIVLINFLAVGFFIAVGVVRSNCRFDSSLRLPCFREAKSPGFSVEGRHASILTLMVS
jgi:hypothetical protein